METLKTAAIVVLLMTVLYSAYVSLTTPPEPLPTDVPELVFSNEATLAFDASLPASLDELGIITGEADEASRPEQVADAALAVATGSSGAGPMVDPPVFEDLAAPQDLETSREMSPDISDVAGSLDTSDSAVNMRLSDNDFGGETVADAPADPPRRRYPRTSTTFQMPDPNDVTSGFSQSADDLSLPETNLVDSKLALASGTSNRAGADDPPAQGEISQAGTIHTPSGSGSSNLGLANAIRTADLQYADDQRREALATLSIFYNTPNLSGEERADLVSRLDPLAREVIYSQRHLLEQPHRVGGSETLMEVAERYEVPWQLLANINQIQDPVTVLPGTELKVVRGPFRAEINLAQKEMTLFLGDLYAGRFPIGVGNDPQPKLGTFTVQDKQTSRTYYDPSGSPVPPGSPNNPYGDVWLDLGGQICIHGSPSTTEPTERGCISLAADYAADLYGILSQGSSVTIRR